MGVYERGESNTGTETDKNRWCLYFLFPETLIRNKQASESFIFSSSKKNLEQSVL